MPVYIAVPPARATLKGEGTMAQKGDAAKLREAFHEGARMFGSLAGAR